MSLFLNLLMNGLLFTEHLGDPRSSNSFVCLSPRTYPSCVFSDILRPSRESTDSDANSCFFVFDRFARKKHKFASTGNSRFPTPSNNSARKTNGVIIKNRLSSLFFYFFMHCLFFAEFTKLVELDFALNQLLIFTAPVIDIFTFLTAEFD